MEYTQYGPFREKIVNWNAEVFFAKYRESKTLAKNSELTVQREWLKRNK